MVTKEKRLWIKSNLQQGDIKRIHQKIGKTPDYETVRGIINGRFYGEHGDVVIKKAEAFVNAKLRKLTAEKKKYGSMVVKKVKVN